LAVFIHAIAANIEDKISYFKSGYSIIEMLEESRDLFVQKTVRDFHEIMHMSRVSYTTESLIDVLFPTIHCS